MADRDMAVRAIHELSLAAWFGGSLMGAIGVNGAASAAGAPQERLRLAGEGWRRWQPVQGAAVAGHVAAAAWITWSNKGRIAGQEGVAPLAFAKGALTGAAIGATALAATVGRRLSRSAGAPVEAATAPSGETPAEVEGAQ